MLFTDKNKKEEIDTSNMVTLNENSLGMIMDDNFINDESLDLSKESKGDSESGDWDLIRTGIIIKEEDQEKEKEKINELEQHIKELREATVKQKEVMAPLVHDLEEELNTSTQRFMALREENNVIHISLREEAKKCMEELDALRSAMMRSIMADRSMRKEEMDALRSFVRTSSVAREDQAKTSLQDAIVALEDRMRSENNMNLSTAHEQIVALMHARLEDVSSSSGQTKEDMKEIQNALNDHRQMVCLLKNENEMLETKVSSLNNQIEEMRAEIVASQEHVCIDHTARSLLEELKENFQGIRNDDALKNRQLKNRVHQLELLVSDTDRNTIMENDIDPWILEKFNSMKEKDNLIKTLQERIIKLEDEVHATQQAMKLLRGEQSTRDALVEQIQTTTQWLSAGNTNMMEQCTNLNKDNIRIKQDMGDIQKKIEELSSEKIKSVEQHENLSNDITRLQKWIDTQNEADAVQLAFGNEKDKNEESPSSFNYMMGQYTQKTDTAVLFLNTQEPTSTENEFTTPFTDNSWREFQFAVPETNTSIKQFQCPPASLWDDIKPSETAALDDLLDLRTSFDQKPLTSHLYNPAYAKPPQFISKNGGSDVV